MPNVQRKSRQSQNPKSPPTPPASKPALGESVEKPGLLATSGSCDGFV